MTPTRVHAASLLFSSVGWFGLVGSAAAQGLPTPNVATTLETRLVHGGDVKGMVDGVLTLMAYTVVPDVTTSTLSVRNAGNENSSVAMTQFGGGFTLSKSVPLYMEGNAAYVRFDPKFLVSDGANQRRLPVRWNSLTGTVGVGWDFALNDEWVLRPILMGSLGRVFSDVTAGSWYVEQKTDLELNFLNGGVLKAAGLGGSVMLDYEHVGKDGAGDRDLEVRYTSVRLRSHAENFESQVTSESLSIWARYRKPTPWTAFERPVRSVWELAHSNYIGKENPVIGSASLTSVGAGLELDLSAHDVFVTRARAVLRFLYGKKAQGVSLGLAVSF